MIKQYKHGNPTKNGEMMMMMINDDDDDSEGWSRSLRQGIHRSWAINWIGAIFFAVSVFSGVVALAWLVARHQLHMMFHDIKKPCYQRSIQVKVCQSVGSRAKEHERTEELPEPSRAFQWDMAPQSFMTARHPKKDVNCCFNGEQAQVPWRDQPPGARSWRSEW